MVRCGIAVYGMDPFGEAPGELRPALRLTSYVAAIKAVPRGESAGYGRRFVAQEPTLWPPCRSATAMACGGR